MPTYSKETALYDTGAIDAGITEAGKTAGRYITAIDNNGIKVHAEDNPTANYTKINAQGMEVYQDGDVVANFGGITNIGAPNSSKITLSQNGVSAQSNEGIDYFNIDSNGGTETQRASWERMTYEIPDTIIPNTDFVDVATFQLSENTSYNSLTTGSTFFLQVTFCTFKPNINVYYSETASDMIKGTSSTWSATRGYYYIKIIYNASSNTVTLSLKRNSRASILELWGHVDLKGCSTKSVVLPTYSFGINMPENSNSLSVSMGDGTIAGARGLAIGKYNTEKAYPFVIGKGTSSTRSNAFEVDWSGNVTATGKGTFGALAINGLAPFTTFTATGTVTLNANSGGNAVVAGTVPTGYTPIAVQSIETAHNQTCLIGKFVLTSDGASITLRNASSSKYTNMSVTATILCTSLQ